MTADEVRVALSRVHRHQRRWLARLPASECAIVVEALHLCDARFVVEPDRPGSRRGRKKA